jgi:uncharacterized protein YfdQ (DUF2303 family)
VADPTVKSIEATAVAEAAELGRHLAVAQQKPQKAEGVLDAAPYIVLRDNAGGDRVEWLYGALPPPMRKTGTVKLSDQESFCLYYGVHGVSAVTYATMRPIAQFVAVFNDHGKDSAGWRDHRAVFTVQHSPEWLVWAASNGKKFDSTEDFARFIEDVSPDIVAPDPATMLAMALNFRVNESVAFSKAIRLQDGHTELVFNNLVSAESGNGAGGKIAIPDLFTIRVRIFDGINSPLYEVDARFRYRLSSGRLSIWYELVRPGRAIENAFAQLVEAITTATGAAVLFGHPE